MCWLLENDISGIGTVWACGDEPLCEGGLEKEVTEQDKKEYVQECALFKMVNKNRDLLDAFRAGFASIVSDEMLSELTSESLRELLNGSVEINVDDWQKNTMYTGKASAKHPVVTMFWKLVRQQMTEEDKKKVRSKQKQKTKEFLIFLFLSFSFFDFALVVTVFLVAGFVICRRICSRLPFWRIVMTDCQVRTLVSIGSNFLTMRRDQ